MMPSKKKKPEKAQVPARKTERAEVLRQRGNLTVDPDNDAVLADFKSMGPAGKDYFARVMFEHATVYQDGMMTALSLSKQEGRRELAEEVLAYILYEPEKETEAEASVRELKHGP